MCKPGRSKCEGECYYVASRSARAGATAWGLPIAQVRDDDSRLRYRARALRLATTTGEINSIESPTRLPNHQHSLRQPLISTASATVAAGSLRPPALSPECVRRASSLPRFTRSRVPLVASLSWRVGRLGAARVAARGGTPNSQTGTNAAREIWSCIGKPLEVDAAASAVLRRACFENRRASNLALPMADRMVSHARPLPRSPPHPTRRARWPKPRSMRRRWRRSCKAASSARAS